MNLFHRLLDIIIEHRDFRLSMDDLIDELPDFEEWQIEEAIYTGEIFKLIQTYKNAHKGVHYGVKS